MPAKVVERTVELMAADVRGGHVNNAAFFRLLHATMQDWYLRMQIDGDEERTAVPLLMHMGIDFLAEMHYPGAMRCRLTVVRVGRSSLEHRAEFFDAGSAGTLCARGKVVHVWFDRTESKTIGWPAELLARCWQG